MQAFFFATVLLIARAVPPSISSMVYTSLKEAKPCVRLLHKDGVIGCGTPYSGSTGTVRYTPSQADFNALVASPPSSYAVALVLPFDLFTEANLKSLNGTVNMAGVMVLPPADKNATGYSTDSKAPNALYDLYGGVNEWNPPGNDFFRASYEFAIVNLINGSEAALMQKRGEDNEAAHRKGHFLSQAVKFDYYMYASENSQKCLEAAKCIPLGGYSVWSTLSKTFNASRPFVFGITGVDATAFFHDMAYGHDQAVSGMVALLAAADSLSKLNDLDTLATQIAFAFFTGERWGYLGSRKFVQEIQEFKCDVPGGADPNKYCSQPYRPNLEFEQINFTNIKRVLELNQVGRGTTNKIYMHYDPNAAARDGDTNAKFAQDIQTAATGVNVDGGGYTAESGYNNNAWKLPPSSSQAFVAADNTLPTIVLTDHQQTYSNKWYSSEFDTLATQDVLNLCHVASLTARTLYTSAGGSTNLNSISANCTLVQELFYCLVQEWGCPLIASYLPQATRVAKRPNQQYVGVYQLMQRKYMRQRTQFLYQFLKFPTKNSTQPYLGSSFYHDAVDPTFVFDYSYQREPKGKRVGKWTWPNLTTSKTELWTESVWSNNIGTYAYERGDPQTSSIMLLTGIALIVATLVATLMAKRKCARHFKTV